MSDELFEAATAEEMIHLREVVEMDILAKVLNTWEGRRVIFNILSKGDIYDLQSAMPLEQDRCQRALGRREVALEVLREALQVDDNVYILMQQEAGAFERRFEMTGSEEDDDGY